MVLVDGVICRGFSTSGVFFFMFLCVGVRTLCELLCAAHAHVVAGVGLIAIDMVAGVWRSVVSLQGDSMNCLVRCFCYSLVCVGDVVLVGVDLWRSVCQHEANSGWILVTTCFGGSVPLLGESSSSDLGCLSVHEASDSSLLGDVMVTGHRLRPGRSTFIVHVYMMCYSRWQQKHVCLRQGGGRLQAQRSDRRRRGRPGGVYKVWVVIFSPFECILVTWAVTIKL
ncbi:unnamed protein product [Urochloa humidicola]